MRPPISSQTSRKDHLPTMVGVAALMLTLTAGCGNDIRQEYDDFLDRTESERVVRGFDYSDIPGQAVALSGDYLVQLDLNPLGEIEFPLRMTVRRSETLEGGEGVLVEGEFRLVEADPSSPALATFTSTIDMAGRMEIEIPRVRIEADESPVEDTAIEVAFTLSVIVVDDAQICGFVGDDESQVFEPIALKLRGTTFAALPYEEDGDEPDDVPSSCETLLGIELGGDDEADAGGDADAGEIEIEPPPLPDLESQRADIGGRFFLQIKAEGLPEFRLVSENTWWEDDEGRASLDSVMRDRTKGAEPAVAHFSVPVDEDGVFVAPIDPLVAPSPIGNVVGRLVLRGMILDEDTFCGVLAGIVFEPFQVPVISERGTFGAVRVPAGFIDIPENATNNCPGLE